MDLLLISLIVALFAILAIAAGGFGVDSREASDDPRRSPYPVGLS